MKGVPYPAARPPSLRRFLLPLLLCLISLGPLSVSLPHALWDQQVDSLHEHQSGHVPEQKELRPAPPAGERELSPDEPPGLPALLGLLQLLQGSVTPLPYPPPRAAPKPPTVPVQHAPRAPPHLA